MHVALARKYRPRRFADLIGQEHVARALKGAVGQARVAHGYLFSGPRGVGKTTAARILAMALNCDTRRSGQPAADPGEPCGSCVSCERIWGGSASLDVVEIDAASNRGVDDARDLRERAMYAASEEGRHKVYIVDEAHMLTREAWNTLLKILEEPPPGVVFVFATTEPQKITNAAAPVMSRLQRFEFRRVGPHSITKRLAEVAAAEGLKVDDDAAQLIGRIADGGLRDALSVLDQVTAFDEGGVSAGRVREVLGLVGDETFAELLDIVAGRRPQDVFPFVARLVEAGVDLVAFADGAGDLWRAVLAVRLGAKPDGVSSALAAEVNRRTASLSPGDVLRILRTLEEAEEPIRRGSTPRLSLEALLTRWALMDRTVEIAEVLRGARNDVHPTPSEPAPAAPAGRPKPGPAAAAPVRQGPLSLDSLRELWPDVLAAARGDRKMMVAEALGDAEAESLADGVVTIKPLGRNAITQETLERNRGAVEAALSRVAGLPVSVRLSGEEAVSVSRPQRVSVKDAKVERTRAFRGRDPALDSAMDALDLELID